jgi:hypothetical protein
LAGEEEQVEETDFAAGVEPGFPLTLIPTRESTSEPAADSVLVYDGPGPALSSASDLSPKSEQTSYEPLLECRPLLPRTVAVAFVQPELAQYASLAVLWPYGQSTSSVSDWAEGSRQSKQRS